MEEQIDWRALAVATGPAERAVAEAGVRLAYRQAGLPEPARILWVGSPLEAVRLLSATVPGADGAPPHTGHSVRAEIRDQPLAAARDALHKRLGPAGWSAHWRTTGAGLWDVTTPLVNRIRQTVVETVGGTRAEESRTRLLLLDAVLGQHDAAWLHALARPRAGLDGLAQVARTAGWWWPYTDLAVLAERPAELHRDEAGRLDRADGPALRWPDGFALHAWRGLPVPGDFLTGLGSLTPARIREEENAELRRVMLEHYGYDRYLTESGATPVHRDDTGVLWRIPLPGDEDVVMVEVVNSTPEPDGTSRTYWLRVPPRTRTAREGVAWTFGLDAEAYTPLRQT
ncbi:DUF6745 domain-containing protein [Streptomyces avicenniae]|uniref:DUF6745 domain-containing protein n=1 Tax=Streptomyces avicenniae TaxID=500153 RepID=UPI00069BE157|nr:hypothetical protein [Streptomyces avicenniae]